MKTESLSTAAMKLFAAACCLLIAASSSGWAAVTRPSTATSQNFNGATPGQPADIEVFVREGCPHCARAEAFLAALGKEQPGLHVVIRDVLKEPGALEQLRRISKNQGITAVSVPAFVIGGQMIVGFSDEAGTGQLIRDRLAQTRTQGRVAPETSNTCQAEENLPCDSGVSRTATTTSPSSVIFFGHSVSPDQLGLPLFALVMGLLDGFNPCSMWVLILMISLLAPMKNRPRMFAVAGTFVAVQGIAYYLFMAAWLNFFLLLGISRASEIIIAALALVAGAINLKDFWKFGSGVSLSIPATAKPGIYARIRRILQADNLIGAMFGAVVLAILVQIVEFVCTSGFPALFTRILTTRQLDTLSYYGYLLLYDLAYMLDDAAVLAIGIITLSQRRLQEREGRWLKLISGVVMIGLGTYLLLVRH